MKERLPYAVFALIAFFCTSTTLLLTRPDNVTYADHKSRRILNYQQVVLLSSVMSIAVFLITYLIFSRASLLEISY
jgi:hypothetical protein